VGDVNEDHRRLKREWKEVQRSTARQTFPLPESELASMFDAVGVAVERDGCAHTLRATTVWLAERPEARAVIAWLAENGGYCDCEVVANAADHFEQNRS
jgi:hypothetical protein